MSGVCMLDILGDDALLILCCDAPVLLVLLCDCDADI